MSVSLWYCLSGCLCGSCDTTNLLMYWCTHSWQWWFLRYNLEIFALEIPSEHKSLQPGQTSQNLQRYFLPPNVTLNSSCPLRFFHVALPTPQMPVKAAWEWEGRSFILKFRMAMRTCEILLRIFFKGRNVMEALYLLKGNPELKSENNWWPHRCHMLTHNKGPAHMGC